MLLDKWRMTMAIYTRFGTPVQLKSAREVPVWIERRPGEIKWHYTEPKRTKKTLELDCVPVWHVTAEATDGSAPRMICDGQELCVNEFRADDGFREIIATCEAMAK